MSADQGSSKVLTLDKSATAPDAIQAPQDLQALEDLPGPQAPPVTDLPASSASANIDTRTLSRSLFLRLAALDENSPERAYVRDTLSELNLPLVRYAAARFSARLPHSACPGLHLRRTRCCRSILLDLIISTSSCPTSLQPRNFIWEYLTRRCTRNLSRVGSVISCCLVRFPKIAQ